MPSLRHLRQGVERDIPLRIWTTSSFQAWYAGVISAGNSLEGAEVLWDFSVKDKVFSWVIKASVYVSKEERIKQNEWVFSKVSFKVEQASSPVSIR